MEDKTQEDFSVTIPLLNGNGDGVVINSKDEQYTNTGNASFISTCFNGLNALSGIGIISIPYAMASGGWLSLILLIVIASSTFYTGLLIQRCMDTDPTLKSYADIGNRAFGKTGKAIVSITVDIELYLVATGFLILEGDNLISLFPDMDFDVYGYRVGGKCGFIVLVALIILPTSWLDNMNILSYISASGVLASMIINLLVTYSLMGVIGYLMFGSNVESQITLNLPTNITSSRVAIWTTLVTPIAKYALEITPIVNAIEARFQYSSYNKRRIGVELVMVGFVLLCGLIVAVVGLWLLHFFRFLPQHSSFERAAICFVEILMMHYTITRSAWILEWFPWIEGLLLRFLPASDLGFFTGKVVNYINKLLELLQHKPFNSTTTALEDIKDALSISPYSRKLLELKGEALFMIFTLIR
ncbi:hypothetical protein L1987_43941 [Smallanthus sonchifolius]|uniref:Uncharacterized protein n=1 Tax=Smallanthus sonchifolius TaxID=185202 RepID=A0ACB9GPD5_9ASTR|nr:hypothetical protein L1987_43941 [Smallanthus sonchifolius]